MHPPSAVGEKLPPDVLKLGWVSFLTDLSSEMIFSVFSVFFTSVAGGSAALLGLIEGLADASASSLNLLSGWLSDHSGRRKSLVVVGYAFSTLAKLILVMSSTVAGLAIFRVVERLGKGFRGPPRDAWLSAMTGSSVRGFAFGVHKALDKAGAVLGPLLAYGILSWWGDPGSNSYSVWTLLFGVAWVPAVLSVWLLIRVPERSGTAFGRAGRATVAVQWQALAPAFKRFLWPAGLFALGYFSLGFLLLRAHGMGFGISHTVLLYALFNGVCVAVAPAVGRLGDRLGRRRIVLAGYALYALLNAWMGVAQSPWEVVGVFSIYGVFYAIDESQTKAFIADLEPQRRATALGLYQSFTGLLYLPASIVAGVLWIDNPLWVFGLAVGLSLMAGVIMVWQTMGSS